MSWNDDLTGTTLNIASSPKKRIRVMAGPGTGKSHAMKRRVARLIEEEGVDPRRILAVTLTRNAARELVSDLQSLGIPGCEQIRVGTLHSYCFRLLNSVGYLTVLNRETRLLLQVEDWSLLRDMVSIGGFGGIRKVQKRIKAFEAAWARMQHETPGWPTDTTDQRFESALLDWMKFHGTMRVGELVPLTLKYLKNNPASEELSAHDHIVVDEYQDLNKAEQELINLLAGNCSCAIVGDEDQSIYSFRHAHPDGIHAFSNTHPDTHDERLEECRRCPKNVVSLADTLISKNHSSTPGSRLQPRPLNPDGIVTVVQWENMDAEINGVVTAISHMIKNGRPLKDFMVLCPNKTIGRDIRNKLREAGIAAHSFYAENALDTKEAQIAFAFLKLIVSSDDRVAMRFLLGINSTTGLAGSYTKLRKYCETNGVSPKDILEDLLSGTVSITGTTELVQRYKEIKDHLNSLSGLTGRTLTEELFPLSEAWALPVRDILNISIDENASPKDIHKALLEALTQPEVPTDAPFVRIMSLHKSKGLASPIVIVVACVQGILPRKSQEDTSPSEEQLFLEEQRRLFYVAMTRTREHLVLSSAIKWPRSAALRMGVMLKPRNSDRANGYAQASQFLDELGPAAPAPILGSAWLATL